MGKTHQRRRQTTDWIEVWVGLFIAVYLLFPGFAGYSGISLAKTWLFYGLSGLLLGVGAMYLVRDLRAKGFRSLTPAQLAALAFLGFTLISAALSPVEKGNPWFDPNAHETALTVSLYVLLFLIVSRWGNPTERLFRVLFWTMVAFCLLCFLQMLGGNPLKLYPGNLNYYDGYGVRYKGAYAGTIGNVDIVSAFLAMTVPILVLRACRQKPRQGWPSLALAAACVGILIWLRVLCGLVGLAMGAVLCLLILCPDRMRKWLLLLFGGLALATPALLWRFDLPGSVLHELHELLHGRFDDSFGTGRFYIWRQMLERVPDRLWFGVGPDMARYSGLAPFVRLDEAGNVAARATITDAHCYPLHILYCQGLPALFSWLTVVGAALVHWVRNRKDGAAALLGGGLLSFLCAMLFCFSSVIVMPFFWLNLGLLEARSAQIKIKRRVQ